MSSRQIALRSSQPPRRRKSRWLWWVWLGAGFLSFIGFVVVAFRVQNQKFRRAAMIATVSCALAWGVYLIWPPVDTTGQSAGDANSDSLAGTNGGWVVMAVWVGLIAYGHFLNRDYRRFLKAEDERTMLKWHGSRAHVRALYQSGGVPSGPPTGAPIPAPTAAPATPRVDRLIEQADRYLASQPLGNRPGPMPPNAPEA